MTIVDKVKSVIADLNNADQVQVLEKEVKEHPEAFGNAAVLDNGKLDSLNFKISKPTVAPAVLPES